MNTSSCPDMLAELERDWDKLEDYDRSYLMSRMVRAGCREVVPYLLRHVKAPEPYHRQQALRGLGWLRCREYRHVFIDRLLNDSDGEVKEAALLNLERAFHGERDKEILSLALSAFDNPASSVALRLTAGAVMMYQLDIPEDEVGGPAWWNEEEGDLRHPSIVRAVDETRKLLSQSKPVLEN